MLYKSQFRENDPYDWFWDPWSHIVQLNISEVNYNWEDNS